MKEARNCKGDSGDVSTGEELVSSLVTADGDMVSILSSLPIFKFKKENSSGVECLLPFDPKYIWPSPVDHGEKGPLSSVGVVMLDTDAALRR